MATPACAICGRPVDTTATTFPFCGERCRLLDLGNWLDERYVVLGTSDDATPIRDDEDDDRLM